MDKDLFLKPSLTEKKVPVPGKGDVVIRALSHDEVQEVRAGLADDATGRIPEGRTLDFLCSLIAASLVDPVLTPDEVAFWRQNSPAGEFARVLDAVDELSGVTEGAQKSGLPANRQGRRAAVRAGTRAKPR